MKKTYLIYIMIFWLLGCMSKSDPFEGFKEFSWRDLPEATRIEGQKLNLDGIMDPRGLLVFEDKIVVAEKSNDYQLDIYSLETGEKLASKGYNGYGPGELTNVWKLERSIEENKFWAYDYNQGAYFLFDLNDSSYLAERWVGKEEAFFYLSEMVWASDTSLWGSMVDGETQYLIFDTEGDTLRHWGNWSSYSDRKDVPVSVTASLHSGRLRSNPKIGMGVRAGVQRDYVEIVDFSSFAHLKISGPENIYPDYEVDYSLGYPMPVVLDRNQYYVDSFVGNEFVYLLYFGGASTERTNPRFAPKLFKMTFEGEVEVVFQLDRPINKIDFSSDEKVLYGLSYDREPDVYRYVLE